jgi:hypothetical protein
MVNVFLTIIHPPVLFKTHNISEAVFFLLQVEHTQLCLTNRASPYLWAPVLKVALTLKQFQCRDHFQN